MISYYADGLIERLCVYVRYISFIILRYLPSLEIFQSDGLRRLFDIGACLSRKLTIHRKFVEILYLLFCTSKQKTS